MTLLLYAFNSSSDHDLGSDDDVSAILMQWVRVPAAPAVPHLSIPKPYVPPDPAALPEPTDNTDKK